MGDEGKSIFQLTYSLVGILHASDLIRGFWATDRKTTIYALKEKGQKRLVSY